MSVTTTSRVYVGTYAKYSAGSIAGQWLDLADFTDADEFNTAARELHADEADPELMFQDWEGIPAHMVSECHVAADLWDWLSLDEDERNRVEACQQLAGDGYCNSLQEWIEFAQDRCQGPYDSFRDFAWEMAEMQFDHQVDSPIWQYFDIEAFCRDLEISGYRWDNETGYVVDLTY
jgi:antirestriction protein